MEADVVTVGFGGPGIDPRRHDWRNPGRAGRAGWKAHFL